MIIIGGGIAGPALALSLRKVGISCALYEAYPISDKVGGGFSIAPNGVHVLDQLGLAEALKQECAHPDFAFFKDESGSLIASIPFADEKRFGQPGLSMSRSLLYCRMAEEMKLKGIEVHYSKKLLRYEEAEGVVVAHFDDGSSATGNILVGADGVKSVVRKQMLPNGPDPEFTGVIGVGGFIPLQSVPAFPANQWSALTFSFGPQGFFGWGGAERGQLMWWSNYLRDEPFGHDDLANLDWDSIKADLLANFGDWPSPIPDCIQNTTRLLRHNIFDIQSLPTWHRGRAILIGDAAHAVTPNSGQGASLALEDALMLAKLLKKASKGATVDHSAVFSLFERERKPRCEAIIAEGRKQGSNKAQVHWIVSKIRNFFIRLVFKLGGASKLYDVMAYKVTLDPEDIAMDDSNPGETTIWMDSSAASSSAPSSSSPS